MRPSTLVVHVASSSLTHIWEANMTVLMLLYLRRETPLSQSVVTKQCPRPHKRNSAESMNCRRTKYKQTQVRTHSHDRHMQNYGTCTHFSTNSSTHIFCQIFTHPHKHMHQSQDFFFLSLRKVHYHTDMTDTFTAHAKSD